MIVTAEGETTDAFGTREWGQISMIACIWGSSYLWMDIGNDALAPYTITLMRVVLGFATLSLFPAARRRVEPADRPRLLLLAIVWQAIPLTLYPIAQQWITSSVAGMLNGALPVLMAVVSSLMLHRPPGRNQLVGMLIGMVGIVFIGLPTWTTGPKLALGVALVFCALLCYSLAGNLAVPLTQKYGSLPVQRGMQRFSVMLTAPLGLWGLGDSQFAWGPVLAVVFLGVVGTGIAFLLAGRMFARVGATRGSSFNYLIPVVAIVLGVAVRGDSVAPLAVVGTVLVLCGAWFCAQAGR
jgi:drug/metabolite transporter (DMT)-like permease